ncbi:WhiB family transcriptional regulator [Streptomyces microflavus]|uniref:WhiB family transcriptional regulator n=1 Tax=Streptomyces microflavus TaxID=1919 RepID=UPI00368AC9B5
MKPACWGEDPEIFYDATRWAKAAEICAECPLMMECREEFKNDPWGYSGGMTPNQRREWRLKLTPEPPLVCRCGKEMVRGHGRPRKHCSDACAQAHWRATKKERRRQDELPPDTQVKITPELEEQVVALWHEGYGVKRAATETGASRSTVNRIFKSHGLTRTPEEQKRLSAEGSARALADGHQADVRRMVRKLVEEGQQTPKAIASLAGCHIGVVYRIRKELST